MGRLRARVRIFCKVQIQSCLSTAGKPTFDTAHCYLTDRRIRVGEIRLIAVATGPEAFPLFLPPPSLEKFGHGEC